MAIFSTTNTFITSVLKINKSDLIIKAAYKLLNNFAQIKQSVFALSFKKLF